jgi:phospholipid transport system transporter-binding protein
MAYVPQAKSVQVVEAAPDRLNVSGALTFETARTAYEIGLRAVCNQQAPSPLQIDCAGVTESDSAGMAVLIEWMANAAKVGRSIRYVNLPEGIRAVAQISDVTEILEAGV